MTTMPAAAQTPISTTLDEEEAWPPCSCGAPSVWWYMPMVQSHPEKSYQCDACVPRGCSCEPNDLYRSFCDATEEDTLEMPGMVPDFVPELHGLRDASGEVVPCCEWYHIDTITEVFDEKTEELIRQALK